MRCAVAVCTMDNQVKGFRETRGIKFFRFPSEHILRKAWINAWKRLDSFNVNNARVCSKHFEEDCFERDFQFELMGSSAKSRRLLKADAVPTLHLRKQIKETKSRDRKDRFKKRNEIKLIKDILQLEFSSQSEIAGGSLGPGHVIDINCNTTSIVDIPENTVSSLYNRRDIGTNTDNENQEEINCKLKEENKHLKNELKAVRKIFTPNQMKKLNNYNKRITWTIEDISRAIVIYSSGARAYKLLLKKGYPLPAVSTLRAWCKKVKLEPGILKQVFMIIKKTDITDLEKVCVLSFDEIKIKKLYMYDKSNDETLKPYNYVQVALLRGLVGNWKQPIFYAYDCPMTKSILFDIIQFAENNGFPVVAIVSDLGGGNRSLHNDLGISTSQTWFINPSTSQKIYVFADVPHIIKLLRNHFVDQGFVLNGTEINKGIIEKLINLTSTTDLNIAHKISMETLHVKGAQRQKVKFATKLFSHTISRAISRCGMLGKFDSENWMECSEFFKDVNDWFDCFNTRVPEEDSRNRTKAFGLSLDLQTSILEKMSAVMSNLRVKGKNYLLPFQKAILISNTSLKLLYDDLKTRFNIKYILTYRLNQDVLENFFGVIRSKGGLHDHPNAVEFRYRFRSYILGKNEGSLSEAGNSQQDNTPDLECNDESILSKQCFSELADPTDDGSSDSDPLLAELDELTYDGLENVAGFICHKLQREEPTVCSASEQSFTWVRHLSEGGLAKPSAEFMTRLSQLEHIFGTANSDTLLIRKGYLSHLLTLASSVQCTTKVKTLFFRTRMYFRMRTLNKSLHDNQLSKKRKMVKITQ